MKIKLAHCEKHQKVQKNKMKMKTTPNPTAQTLLTCGVYPSWLSSKGVCEDVHIH